MIDTDNIIIAYFSCLFVFLFTRMGGSRKVKFSVPRSWKDTAGGKQKIWCFSGLEPHNQTKYCFRDVAWLFARTTPSLIIQNTRAFSTYWLSETHSGNWKLCTVCGPFSLKQMRFKTRSHFTCSLKPRFVAVDAMSKVCVQVDKNALLRIWSSFFLEKQSKLEKI